MKRIALIISMLAAAAAGVVTSAGAADSKTYQAELYNAFGLVKGSELRVAGVKAGTVTGLDVTDAKTALITFEVGPEFPELNADASCSSEPQSLIAEYFLDCQPGSSEQPLTTPIPAASNQTTVQTDLVQNTLREPFKRRFQLLINEFGTALVGNPENLNAAIRAGAPALQQLKQVLNILGRQNRIIAGLNSDSDAIFAQLTDRREDVVSFIDNAGTAAAISAERREDLARNFDLLDDFLFELRPVMVELGNLAREQTPLLTDLRAAAPGLNKLGTNLPAFNDGTRVSLNSLGGAAEVGKRALSKSEDEIAEIKRVGESAPHVADQLVSFLVDIDDRGRAYEPDARSPGGKGFTGFENLLNYVYWQPGALNQYDEIGHLLHVVQYEPETPCGSVNPGPGVPAEGGGITTNPADRHRCVSWTGPNQPGITRPVNLPRYDDSVCPDGSTRPDLCDPTISTDSSSSSHAGSPRGDLEQVQQVLERFDKEGQRGQKEELENLRDLLGLPPGVPLPQSVTQGLGTGTSTATPPAATGGLLDFLFGP
jgi:ABC-type transporter Mla subunit MlaD